MKKILVLIAAIGAMYSASAQESAIFTQYYLNPVLINPGATGFENNHTFLFDFRSKWADFDGAPRSFTLLYHGEASDHTGLGAQLFTESIGELRRFQGQLNYAYKFYTESLEMGIGLYAGIQQLSISSVGDDPFIDNTDMLLNEALDGVTLFDGGLGAYGEYNDRLFFGLSFPNLVRERLKEIEGDVAFDDQGFNFVALLGYRFDITNYNFTIEPSILIREVRRVPFGVDINLKLAFLEEQLIGGLTYSFGEMSRVGVLVGTRINTLKFFYSYDVGFGDFQQFNNGSHELTISYTLPTREKTTSE